MNVSPSILAEYDAMWAEYELICQMVADGELCSVDGKPCEFETRHYKDGEDRDGNRGWWVSETACHKCGERPR